MRESNNISKQREKCGFEKDQKNQKRQKKQLMLTTIVDQKAENYMLKCGLVGGGVLHVELREQ
jgi:hypothetical protein